MLRLASAAITLAAAALAFHPETFDAGIDIFGVTNWVRTLESIPAWWGAQRTALFDEMGDPATDAERHRAISPLFHAARIRRPMRSNISSSRTRGTAS